MFEKVFDVLLGSFSQAISKDPTQFWVGVIFLGAAMGTIFGFMQIVKVVLKAIRKKSDHGLPRVILVLSPLALGYAFMWGHHAFFPIFIHKQMIVLGIILGALNILIYETWKRKGKICDFITKFRISFGSQK